ncbi:MAG: transglycosylase SLT domain-containing protein [Deltaproteobacteria bacterium]|nr:transglycosylase SLT domain-containing protein [Deltaproteobacteria bacterium]
MAVRASSFRWRLALVLFSSLLATDTGAFGATRPSLEHFRCLGFAGAFVQAGRLRLASSKLDQCGATASSILHAAVTVVRAELKKEQGRTSESLRMLARLVQDASGDRLPYSDRTFMQFIKLDVADALIQQGRSREAQSLLDSLVVAPWAGWSRAAIMRAKLLVALGRTGEAAQAFEDLARRYGGMPIAAWYRLRSARLWIRLGKKVWAHGLLTDAAVLDAGSRWDGIILSRLGRLKLSTSRLRRRCDGLARAYRVKEALKCYRAVEKKGRLGNDGSLAMARLFMLAGDCSRALALAMRVRRRSAGARALADRIRRGCLRRTGRFEDLARWLQKRVGAGRGKLSRLANAGSQAERLAAARAWLAVGRYLRALAVLARRPRSGRERFLRGYLLGRTGSYEEAVSQLAGLSGGRLHGKAAYWRAVFLQAAARKTEAQRLFAQVARKWPLGYYGTLAKARLWTTLGPQHGVHAMEQGLMVSFVPSVHVLPAALRTLLSQRQGVAKWYRIALWLALVGRTDAARLQLRYGAICGGLTGLPRRVRAMMTREFVGGCPIRRMRPVSRRLVGKLAAWLDDWSLVRWSWTAHARSLPFREMVEADSRRFGMPAPWIWAVMAAESGFESWARSRVGAVGLMQIMPHTGRRIASSLGMKQYSGQDLWKPETNIRFGIWYLAQLHRSFRRQFVVTLCAYNAGPDQVRRWLHRTGARSIDAFVEELPYRDTARYVRRIVTLAQQDRAATGLPAPRMLSLRLDRKVKKDIDF